MIEVLFEVFVTPMLVTDDLALTSLFLLRNSRSDFQPTSCRVKTFPCQK